MENIFKPIILFIFIYITISYASVGIYLNLLHLFTFSVPHRIIRFFFGMGIKKMWSHVWKCTWMSCTKVSFFGILLLNKEMYYLSWDVSKMKMYHLIKDGWSINYLQTLTILIWSTDSLQNPDFEILPTNLTSNATSHKWLLAGANSLRGWSLNGTVWYVASAGNSSFPNNGGHAVQLGPNGKINQTFTATDKDVSQYVLSFTLAAQSMDCANNRTALNVTLRDVGYRNISTVLYLQEDSRRDLWERHALFLGQLGGKDSVHIEIESVDTTSRENTTTCWPLVDAFSVKRNVEPRWYDNGMTSFNINFTIYNFLCTFRIFCSIFFFHFFFVLINFLK